ncbi:MAG: tungstate ABC transporter substrate-binding protein WtpA, partial [Chitinivibrionales bacterium]|nr:tungstate ABC transporter substrate-binding protein WtpA [Chitinivibrionales bacterium]
HYYGRPGLADAFLKKDRKYIRPKEVDLLALLESHTIDYLFLYRSVAAQHTLDYIILPDSINLKKTELNNFYSRATVNISGKKPGTTISKSGAAMVYGATIPSDAPNPDGALAFMRFLLDENKGMQIMEHNGQPSTVPSATRHYSSIPAPLRKYALPDKE